MALMVKKSEAQTLEVSRANSVVVMSKRAVAPLAVIGKKLLDFIIDGGNASSVHTQIIDGGNASSVHTQFIDGGSA